MRQEKDICEVNPPNSSLEMYGKESRAIVKTACEDCLEGSVGHGLQEELGLQEQYSPGRDASQLCRVVAGVEVRGASEGPRKYHERPSQKSYVPTAMKTVPFPPLLIP